tara:strand:- start:2776 stop:3042 length:267 start_codon:yes stop_codon:yes gene_type:complete
MKWRNKSNKYMATRAITKEELPKLIKAMIDDNVMATITSEGIKWTVGAYSVTKKSIADVWELTPSQMQRVIEYIYGYDPFYKTYDLEE